MESPIFWFVALSVGLLLLGVALFYWRSVGRHHPPLQLPDAIRAFRQHATELHEKFFQAASTSGKPRGLRWKECQWNELTEWVRDKATGQLLALVGLTISFEAIEGGDMEGVEAVGNLRNASAVFFYQDGEWRTVGRVIFNLNPDEAVAHFQGGYERVIDG